MNHSCSSSCTGECFNRRYSTATTASDNANTEIKIKEENKLIDEYYKISDLIAIEFKKLLDLKYNYMDNLLNNNNDITIIQLKEQIKKSTLDIYKIFSDAKMEADKMKYHSTEYKNHIEKNIILFRNNLNKVDTFITTKTNKWIPSCSQNE